MTAPQSVSPATALLLPCPFCGGAPVVVEIEPHSHTGGIADFMPDHPGSAYIDCACGVGTIDATAELVTARWNKRCCVPAQTSGMPTIPDDDSDFTPELARRIIAKYQQLLSARQAAGGSDRSSIVLRLRDAAQTAQNDDLSKPQTEKRQRHIIRVEAILDAAEYLEEMAAQPSQGAGNGEADIQPSAWRWHAPGEVRWSFGAYPPNDDAFTKQPLFAAPQPTTAGYTPNVPRFMEVVRSRWNFEENEFDAIEKVLLDPKCAAALSLTSTSQLTAAPLDPETPTCSICGARVFDPCRTMERAKHCELPPGTEYSEAGK